VEIKRKRVTGALLLPFHEEIERGYDNRCYGDTGYNEPGAVPSWLGRLLHRL
jgi:hypothetical protein